MNKILIVILILVIIGAGFFYFLYLAPPSETPTAGQTNQVATLDTSFDLGVLNKLDSFFAHGNFPITVNDSSLRKSDPAKANDPFFN